MKKIKDLKKRLGLISASALILLGGTAVSSHVHANADANSNTITPNVSKIQKDVPNTNSKLEKVPKQQIVVSQPVQQLNSDQSEEVTQQSNELKDRIIQNVLGQNDTNQNSSVSQVPQKQYQVVPNNEQQNITIIKQAPQEANSNQQNIPSNAPAPVKHERKNNSKDINPRFRKDAQGLLDDLKVVANSPVDVPDANLNHKTNNNRLESNPDNSSNIGNNK